MRSSASGLPGVAGGPLLTSPSRGWSTIGLPPRRIDILTAISGVTFDEAWASRVVGDVDGRTVSFIGRAALLTNKTAAGRPKDIADAARLRRMKPDR